MNEKYETIEAMPGTTILARCTYRVVFRPRARGYAEALTGLPEPLEILGAVSGVVTMLPQGCRVVPDYRPGRSGVRRAGVTLWPAAVDPAFDTWVDLNNPSEVPVSLDGLKLVVANFRSNCPTCGR